MSEPLTYNNFKSTTIRGNFINADSPNGDILADGTFDRNLTIKGDLFLGNFDTGNGGNIKLKVDDVEATITSRQLLSAVNPQLLIIDDFVIYFDQFEIGSQYIWAFV